MRRIRRLSNTDEDLISVRAQQNDYDEFEGDGEKQNQPIGFVNKLIIEKGRARASKTSLATDKKIVPLTEMPTTQESAVETTDTPSSLGIRCNSVTLHRIIVQVRPKIFFLRRSNFSPKNQRERKNKTLFR